MIVSKTSISITAKPSFWLCRFTNERDPGMMQIKLDETIVPSFLSRAILCLAVFLSLIVWAWAWVSRQTKLSTSWRRVHGRHRHQLARMPFCLETCARLRPLGGAAARGLSARARGAPTL